MGNRNGFFLDARMLIGVAVASAGVLLILNNLDYTDFDVLSLWPLLLVVVGLSQVVKPRAYRHLTSGIIFMTAGLLLLADSLGYIHFRIWDFWPVLLIFAGLGMLTHGYHKKHKDSASDSDFIDLSLILGGGEYTYASQKLKGGKIAAILGGGDIDMRKADMAGEEIVLDVFAFWGGIEIKVPEHWNVVMHATPVLAGVENKTGAGGGSKNKTLIVKGSAVMGGIEVTK